MHARELVDRIGELSASGRALVGLTGAPGVGKSHTAGLLVKALTSTGTPASLVPMDGFHLANRQLDRLGLRDHKGAPETFDVDGYVRLLEVLRGRPERPVYAPEFDRALEESLAAGLVVEPTDTVVVTEGNYLLHTDGGWGRVAGLLDLSIFLEAPYEVRRARLIERHVAGGRTPRAAAAWADEVDGANAVLIESTRLRADVVADAATLADELVALALEP